MKPRLVLGVSLLAALGACQPVSNQPPVSGPTAPPSASMSYQVSGVVYNLDLRPLAGVEIMADGNPSLKATTDESGRYQLALTPGPHRLRASFKSYTEREREIAVTQDLVVNFGGTQGADRNAYFLANAPEVSGVQVDMKAAAEREVTLSLSEPLPLEARTALTDRLELRTADSRFVSSIVGPLAELRITTSWSENGTQLKVSVVGPLLANANADTAYELRLRQKETTTLASPRPEDRTWEEMRINDAEGTPIGLGRAAWAFKVPSERFPQNISAANLVDRQLGNSPEERAWAGTHQPYANLLVARDTVAPALSSLELQRETAIGTATYDTLVLHCSEPMAVVKDAANPWFTQLDRERSPLTLALSKKPGGENATLYEQAPLRVRIATFDPSIVYCDYPVGVFKDIKWLQATLSGEFKDPAGNAPAPGNAQVVWEYN